MGGKRPDQYRIDPAEAGATDYKQRGERAVPEQEKEKYTRQDKADTDGIPHSEDNPALADLKAKREAKREARRDAEERDAEEDGAEEDGATRRSGGEG